MKLDVMRPATLILLCVGLLSQAAWSQDDAEELERVRATVSELFSGVDAKDIFASQVDGWYTIRKGAIVAYISADGRYLLQGDLIDLQAKANLSEKERNEARKEMLASMPDDETIIFKPEHVKHVVSVFTDVDCTFCRRLHSQIDQYMDEGIEIRYLLYPRTGPNSPSWTRAEKVWCADDRKEALTLAKLDKDFPTHDCDASIVSAHYEMGQDVGLRGTPAIVLEDGTLFSGYLPPKQLAEAIETTLAGD